MKRRLRRGAPLADILRATSPVGKREGYPASQLILASRLKEKTVTVICPYCQQPAVLVGGEMIYPHRPDLFTRKFWLCRPCGAYVGTHANSHRYAPLGRLANIELREAKMAAHRAFDPQWRSGNKTRADAYAWLAKHLGISVEECHIGRFNVETCKRIVRVCLEKSC